MTYYTDVQTSYGYAPGSGVVGVRNPSNGKYLELSHYQYGALVKHNGQIVEMFINDDPGGIGELSVRGIAAHRGSRINARNGLDTISSALGAMDDRAGLFVIGNPDHLPRDMRIGHARPDGGFAFVTGIGDMLQDGEEVARIGPEGLSLRHHAEPPSPPPGMTVLWARDDGTLHATANVGGEVSTVQMGPAT